jgi:hypothetical protein
VVAYHDATLAPPPCDRRQIAGGSSKEPAAAGAADESAAGHDIPRVELMQTHGSNLKQSYPEDGRRNVAAEEREGLVVGFQPTG